MPTETAASQPFRLPIYRRLLLCSTLRSASASTHPLRLPQPMLTAWGGWKRGSTDCGSRMCAPGDGRRSPELLVGPGRSGGELTSTNNLHRHVRWCMSVKQWQGMHDISRKWREYVTGMPSCLFVRKDRMAFRWHIHVRYATIRGGILRGGLYLRSMLSLVCYRGCIIAPGVFPLMPWKWQHNNTPISGNLTNDGNGACFELAKYVDQS